ncbi:MAG: hypothetical protein HYY49_11995 [Ignavibacteriales bacterium]|nr:hypothetical protein [Ignavibacteriales bacterium]
MMFLWLIVGLVLVTIAFFLPGSPQDVWPNLNLAGIVAAIYILALIAYTLRSPFGKKAQAIVWIITLLTLPALGMFWTGMDTTSHWQHNKLLSIREMIGRGIIAAEVSDTLLSVLDEYHNQKGGKKTTLHQVFQRRYPRVMVGDNIHLPGYPGDSLRIFMSSLSDDAIMLDAQEMYVKGRDPAFKNFNGRTGMVQERYTLTAKGVHHESQN